MQNTDCSLSCKMDNEIKQSCEMCRAYERTREIEIFGKKLTVKNYICSPDGINYRKKPENVEMQLFINMLTFCPAGCRFCVAKDTKLERKIDTEKLSSVMRALKQESRVRGIKITGGEPFYDIGLLNETISILYEIFGYDLELSVSTNGIGLSNLQKIKDLSHLEAIHISRHHYDDRVNLEIFGLPDSDKARIPSGDELKEIVESISYKDIFVFNCLLLKDYINSPEEAHRFMDFAIETGVPKVGFVTCSPINEYARQQTVAYEAVIKEDDPSLLFTRGFFDYEYCHCSDGVYSSEDGRIVEFYGKSTKMEKYRYCRGIVYDADNHLKDGFGGEIII